MPGMGRPQPGAAPKKEKALEGMNRVRYILQQLELAPEQRANAEGLAETMFSAGAPEGAQSPIDLEKVRAIWAELEAAQKANDKPKIDKLSEELREMGRSAQGENKAQVTSGSDTEFLNNLEKSLNDQQKARLKETLGRLQTNPSGQLRPVDVLRAARATAGLDDKQAKSLADVEAKFRTDINTRDEKAATAEERRNTLLDGLIRDARAALTPPQAEAFDKKIALLRPAALASAALTIPAAAAKPAEAPAGGPGSVSKP